MRRDIEKTYSRKAFVAKLHRLADALERGERFATQVAGRRVVVPRAAVFGIEREGGIEEIEFQITWKAARRRKAPPVTPRRTHRFRNQRRQPRVSVQGSSAAATPRRRAASRAAP